MRTSGSSLTPSFSHTACCTLAIRARKSGGGAVFIVHKEARVQGGYAGPAHAQALEAALIDHRARKTALWTLECTAAAWQRKGLLLTAAGVNSRMDGSGGFSRLGKQPP